MALGQSLKVLLGADADPLIKELNKASREVKRWGKDVSASLSTVRDTVNTVFGIGLAGGAVAFVKHTLDTVSALKDQADQIGLNVEAFQALKFAANQAGVDQETLSTGLNRLSRLLGEAYDSTSEAAKIFEKWQISVKDARGNLLPLEDVLNQVADRMASIENPALRSAAAVDLLSKGGPALINFLAEGSDGMKEMTKEAREMGAIIGEDTVKKAKLASDQLAALGDVITAKLMGAIVDFLPTARQLSDWLDKLGQWTGLKSIFDTKDIDIMQDRLEALESKRKVWANSPWVSDQEKQDLDQFIIRLRAHIAAVEEAKRVSALPVVAKAERKEPTQGFVPKIFDDSKAKKAAQNIENATKAYDEFILRLKQEHELLGLTEQDREKQKAAFEIENQLRKYGIGLTKQQRDEVMALAAANAELKKIQEEAADKMAEMKQFGNDLASSMSSAFEDAVLSGKELKSVIAGLTEDIARMILRMAVLKPLSDGIGSFLGGGLGSFFGDIFGGFRANGGPVSPGRAYVVGERGPELFAPNIGGNIVSNARLGGGGSVNQFNFNVRVDGAAAGDPKAAAKAGNEFAVAAKSTILGILQEQQRPGGLLFGK